MLVAFDPSATGARSATLELATSGPTLTSGALSGTGRDLEVSIGSHDFGAVAAPGGSHSGSAASAGRRKSVRIPAGRTATVRLALTKAQRKALRRKASLTVTLGGATRTLPLTIRVPKER